MFWVEFSSSSLFLIRFYRYGYDQKILEGNEGLQTAKQYLTKNPTLQPKSTRKGRIFGIKLTLGWLEGKDEKQAIQYINEDPDYKTDYINESSGTGRPLKKPPNFGDLPTSHIPATMDNIKDGDFKECLGSYYEGLFRKNKKHGYGKFVFDNYDIYIGEFNADVITGKGVYRYSDGRVYDGDFVGNLKHGKGVYFMHEGVVYDGDFYRGDREGKGTVTWYEI